MTVNFTHWHKSSYSAPDGECIEVGRSTQGDVGMRDTKQGGDGPVLSFTRSEWAALMQAVRSDHGRA